MIDHLVNGKLPYVDNTPGTGQLRIDWIKNGERLCGASSQISNDGSYNRPTLNVQHNVEDLDVRQTAAVDKINVLVDAVNLIQDNLGHLGDTSIIAQVNQNTTDIAELKIHTSELDVKSDNFETSINEINTKLGHRYVDDLTTRTIYGDLFWIKNELGAYAGFDINGNAVPGSVGSGLKYRFAQVNSAVVNNTNRISQLESDWQNSDVGQLTTDLADMRYEIGRKQLANGINIYTRIKNLEDSMGSDAGAVDDIKDAIDFTNQLTIATRVTQLESTTSSLTNTINRPTTGVLDRLTSVENTIGNINTPYTILHDVNRNAQSIVSINQILGADSSSGIRGEIAMLNTEIGQSNESGSINGRIAVLQQEVSQNTLTINDLSAKVGNASSGLMGANVIMSTDLYGDASSTDPFAVDGIKKVAKQYFTDKPNILNRPANNGTWIYSNGAWKRQTSIMVAVEKKSFTADVVETEETIPFVDFEQTIANGVVFNEGIIEFTDDGMVQAKIEVELGDLIDTDNYEVSISHEKLDGTITHTPMQEFTLRSNSKRLYTRYWLYTMTTGDKVSVSIKALDSASVKTVTIRDMAIIIVPV